MLEHIIQLYNQLLYIQLYMYLNANDFNYILTQQCMPLQAHNIHVHVPVISLTPPSK